MVAEGRAGERDPGKFAHRPEARRVVLYRPREREQTGTANRLALKSALEAANLLNGQFCQDNADKIIACQKQ